MKLDPLPSYVCEEITFGLFKITVGSERWMFLICAVITSTLPFDSSQNDMWNKYIQYSWYDNVIYVDSDNPIAISSCWWQLGQPRGE